MHGFVRYAVAAVSVVLFLAAAPLADVPASDDSPMRLPPAPLQTLPVSNADALSRFFSARAAGGPLRVLHIGDSHIARDAFSGDLRAMLTDGHTPGARGMIPPGPVYPFFAARGIEVDMSDGWTVHRARNDDASGPFGLMNARVEAAPATSPWIVVSGIDHPADRLVIGYWRQPDGGAIQVRVDAALHAFQTDGNNGPAFAAVPVPEGTQIIRVSAAGDGPVALLSLSLEADEAGVTLSNTGWPGATAQIMTQWDDDVLRMELARLAPHLIIISYGTNEGFDDELDLAAYETTLRNQLMRLKRFAPSASLLLTGGPDGTRLPFYADTDARAPHEWTCAPLTDAERRDYAALMEAESETLLRWHDPPHLSSVLALQKRVALEAGVAHWNWRQAMGGACAVHDWRLAEPQWARPDHVHLTSAGYAASAAALAAALNGAFVAWTALREGETVSDRDRSHSGATKD